MNLSHKIRPDKLLPVVILLLTLGGWLAAGWAATGKAAPETPTSWIWQAAADLTVPRMNHTAHLLPDGRVVVIGGISDWSNVIRLNSAEVYDPTTNSWSLYPNGSNSFRNQHTSTLLNDGRILVIGGDDNFGGVVDSAEIFDPLAGTWTAVASPGPMANHAAVLLGDGSVLVFGGYSGYTGGSPDYILHAMRYDVATNTWNYAGQTDLYEATGERLGDGRVLAMARGWGGFKVYNPADDSWTIVNGPNINWNAYWGVSLTRYNGAVYFAGYGEDVTYYAGSGWGGVGALAVNRNTHAATAVNGGIMLIGGVDAEYNYPTSVEINGVIVGNLQTGRTWHTATTLNDGRVLISGGLVPGPVVLSSVEIGEPAGYATATPTMTPTITPTPTVTPTPTATPRTDGVIGGRIWLDEGTWAVQDGEPGLANLEVRLYTNQGGQLVDDTTTDADGRYTFSNLAAAPGIVYTVYIYTPVRHAFVAPNVGSDDTIDSDVDYSQPVSSDENGIWVGSMTVPMDGTNLVQTEWDAGMHSNVLTGRIWWDWTNGLNTDVTNGLQDPEEPGFEGVQVFINSGTPPNGTIVRTVTTDVNGIFTATNLIPGSYWVSTLFASKPEYWRSEANQGNDDTIDSDAGFGNPSCYPDPNCPLFTPAITLPTNGAGLRQDFGIVARANFRLRAVEWWMENGQSHQDYMPFAIPVAMFWRQIADNNSYYSERFLTNLSIVGFKELRGLAKGTYRFVWSKPAGYLIRPPSGLAGPTEPDPTTGSTGQIPIPTQTNRYGLGGMSEAFYYKPDASGAATPQEGGSVSTGGQSAMMHTAVLTPPITLTVPPGAITETITLHLTQVTADAGYLPRAEGYLPTGFGALWEVTVSDVQRYGYALQTPATLTLPFDATNFLWGEDADLHLLWWNAAAGQWETPSSTCGAAPTVINLQTGWLTAELCRAGQYGLFQTGWQLYLPTVVR